MLKHSVNHCISILFHNLWYVSAHELILVVWYHVWQKILLNKLCGLPINTQLLKLMLKNIVIGMSSLSDSCNNLLVVHTNIVM